ncbi:hypothetical protein [uncultured Pontibacter sp.]|uniref:hypothetical protein n=1 Tax=uncultured Pontibacter sp. TaxID=453356 RepID=UPI0026224392|nr:hypothetical protein [uncultured Pontibacter sp.]
MKDLLTIINTERSSLLRGFIVVFMLVLPFSFIPFIARQGFSAQTISQSLPDAMLYAAIFALGLIIVALLNNYEKLLQKKRLYDLPAFTALHFNGAVEGYNSIIKELSTYLIGKAGDYFFRVNIADTSRKLVKIEISPLVYIGQDTDLLQKLIQELDLREELYLSKVLSLSEENLQQSDLLLTEINRLAGELASAGVTPLEVNDISLSIN